MRSTYAVSCAMQLQLWMRVHTFRMYETAIRNVFLSRHQTIYSLISFITVIDWRFKRRQARLWALLGGEPPSRAKRCQRRSMSEMQG